MLVDNRFKCQIAYDGTDYSGWQRQPNAPSIQQTIEQCLTKLARQPIGIVGCGRTDAGVHASDYYFHMDWPAGQYAIDVDTLMFKLNRMLPTAIVLHSAQITTPKWHARYDATLRAYTYYIHFDRDPFNDRFSYHYPLADQLDLSLLSQVANEFLQHKDFATFCKTHAASNTTLCDIYSVQWIYDEAQSTLRFEIEANRFLRGMIRLMVGASLNIARGKLSIQELRDALHERRQLSMPWSAPAKGLFLSKVSYPESE